MRKVTVKCRYCGCFEQHTIEQKIQGEPFSLLSGERPMARTSLCRADCCHEFPIKTDYIWEILPPTQSLPKRPILDAMV